MKKIHIIELSVALGLVISIVFSIFSFGAECQKIRNGVIRLHILANSDSVKDQEIKLKVRDTLLNCGSDLFNGKMNSENAENIIEKNKSELTNIINNVLNENGFNYNSEIYLTNQYFETREYDGFIMPAGQYKAIKIVLGEGKGQNWWCVMFPPLCLPAATEKVSVDAFFTEKGTEIITNNEKYIAKLKIIELFESVKAYIKAK